MKISSFPNLYLSFIIVIHFRNHISDSRIVRFEGSTHGYKKTLDFVDKSDSHPVIFAIRQRNVESLKRKLMEVSDPMSPQYTKYLSSKEVADIASNSDGREALISYLLREGIEITHETLHGDFVMASAPISRWEAVFSTEFQIYEHSQNSEKRVYRASHYTLHESVSDHIMGVFNLIHFPMKLSVDRPIVKSEQAGIQTSIPTGYITPSKLNSFYNIFTNNGSMSTTQAIYSAIGQKFSSQDLAYFQSIFHIPPHPVDADPDGREDATLCKTRPNDCSESSLDLQYITAIAQNTYTSIM